MTKRAFAFLLATCITAATAPALAQDELNLLTWCDHDDAVVAEFEAANNVNVNIKSYELTGAALSLLEQSKPGEWDVFVVDTADVIRFAQGGWLAPLNAADFPYGDMFEGLKMDELHILDGKLYGVPEKVGYNTIAYDNRAFAKDGNLTMAEMFKPEQAGRIAVYDYYLPIMQSLALTKGIKPKDFNEAALDAIRDDLMALKAQSKLVGDVTTVTTALATGDVDVVFGAAEWASALKAEKPHIAWGTPAEGGMRWSQSVAIFEGSAKKDLSLKLAQYLMSPEGQGKLATAACYWGVPVNKKAVLTDAQKAALQWDNAEAMIANSYAFSFVGEELDAKMQEMWTEFLAQ
jgi:spermidine/putrescine transport system substrate-binding protein